MFNGIAIQQSLDGAARNPFPGTEPGAKDICSFVQTGNFHLDLVASKVVFDAEALRLHAVPDRDGEFGIGEWISLYHVDDRISVLKLIKQATTMLRGFRFQARTAGALDLPPTIECYARCEADGFRGIFLSSRLSYAFVE